MVVNARNRQKIVDWIHAHLPRERAEVPGREVIFTDLSRLWAMFAIQGPKASTLTTVGELDLKWMRYYRGTRVQLLHPGAAGKAASSAAPVTRRRRFRTERGGRNRPGDLASHRRTR